MINEEQHNKQLREVNRSKHIRPVPGYPGIEVFQCNGRVMDRNTNEQVKGYKKHFDRPLLKDSEIGLFKLFDWYVRVRNESGELVEVAIRDLIHLAFERKEIQSRFFRYKRVENVFDPPRRKPNPEKLKRLLKCVDQIFKSHPNDLQKHY